MWHQTIKMCEVNNFRGFRQIESELQDWMHYPVNVDLVFQGVQRAAVRDERGSWSMQTTMRLGCVVAGCMQVYADVSLETMRHLYRDDLHLPDFPTFGDSLGINLTTKRLWLDMRKKLIRIPMGVDRLGMPTF